MRHDSTQVFEKDGEWYVGWSPAIPGANGQGRTMEECRSNPAAAISLALQDRLEDAIDL